MTANPQTRQPDHQQKKPVKGKALAEAAAKDVATGPEEVWDVAEVAMVAVAVKGAAVDKNHSSMLNFLKLTAGYIVHIAVTKSSDVGSVDGYTI